MLISVTCPHCRNQAKAPDHFLGRRVRCKKCNRHFVLPPAHRPSSPSLVIPESSSAESVADEPLPVVQPLTLSSASRRTAAPLPPTPEVKRQGKEVSHRYVLFWLLAAVLLTAGVGVGGWYFFRTGNAAVSGRYGRYAGIEISSSAVKVVVVDFSPTADSWTFSTVSAKEDRTDLVKSLSADGTTFDSAVLEKTVQAVKAAFDDFHDKQRIPADRIYLVCSSGPFAAISKKVQEVNKEKPSEDIAKAVKAASEKNERILKDAVMAAVGKKIAFVDEAQEGKYCFMACVPPKEQSQALFLDIGSGNTKGGYMTADLIFKPIRKFDLGTKTYYELVKGEEKKRGKELMDSDREILRKEKLNTPLHKLIEDTPGLNQQHKIYLIGGIVWAMSTYTHPDEIRKNKNFLRVILINKNITDFHQWVTTKSRDELHSEALKDAGKDQETAVAEELKRVEDVFKEPKELIAGAEILLALSQEFEFQGKDLFFLTDSQYALVLGHIITQIGLEE
jgi:hypothetical protein